MSVGKGKYVPISSLEEEEFPYVIEDPIDPTYNPGYTVDRVRFSTIVFEFKRAYLAIAHKEPRLLEVPYKGI